MKRYTLQNPATGLYIRRPRPGDDSLIDLGDAGSLLLFDQVAPSATLPYADALLLARSISVPVTICEIMKLPDA